MTYEPTTVEEKLQYYALDRYSPGYEAFITFDQPLACTNEDCKVPAHWGEYAGGQLKPFCPLHGFAHYTYDIGGFDANHKPILTPHEQAEQAKCIIRFVLFMHGNQGDAKVLAPIAIEDAPGWHIWQRSNFGSEDEYHDWKYRSYPLHAWTVEYTAQPGTPTTRVVVVFDEEYWSFHLCDGTVTPPQNGWED